MTAPMPDPLPWERQKGETRQAFEAFRGYRDMGPTRTQRGLAQQLGKSTHLLGMWSTKWKWVERTSAYDAMVDSEARAAMLDEIRTMHRRHAQVAGRIVTVVAQRLMGDDVLGVAALDPAKLSARDIVALLEVAVKIERMARGEAESRISVQTRGAGDEYDLSELVMSDPDMLERAEELATLMLEREAVVRRPNLRAV